MGVARGWRAMCCSTGSAPADGGSFHRSAGSAAGRAWGAAGEPGRGHGRGARRARLPAAAGPGAPSHGRAQGRLTSGRWRAGRTVAERPGLAVTRRLRVRSVGGWCDGCRGPTIAGAAPVRTGTQWASADGATTGEGGGLRQGPDAGLRRWRGPGRQPHVAGGDGRSTGLRRRGLVAQAWWAGTRAPALD